ncbi:hypothetical protein C2G38_2047968 [Gigaspora rosea]|uniref:Uncharacterized protein n=1 Tax=Gigaspora rosea TaxID=44941 RepID=A0A397U427_9GLOM|nr:hypothetical protein C2G38_2047968 [Gigaspora rosea]
MVYKYKDIQDSQDEHLLLENDLDSNISDVQPVNDTTKNNKLDKSKSSDSNSYYLSQQTSTSSSSKYFLNNYEDDDLSNSESESSISNNTSKTLSSSKYLQNNRFNSNTSGSINIRNSITKSNHIEHSTDNTLNKILDTILANQTNLKTLLHLHEEIKSTIRLQSEEIKKIKDKLNDSHKTDEASSRTQWVEPYWKYIINDILPDFKYPSDETIKSVALRILSSKQPERMRFLINNEEWDSFFRSAICSIAKDKICKHRGTIVKKIKDKLFEVFHDKLNKIDSSASADTIKTFKESQNTKWCLRKLNAPISTMSSQTYMDSIISKVWVKDQPTEDDKVFAIAICLYILDPKYEGMKLDPEKVNYLYRSLKASIILFVLFFLKKLRLIILS